MRNDPQNSLTLKEAKVIFSFSEKAEVPKAFRNENWFLHLFKIQLFPGMVPLSTFWRFLLSLSEALGRDSVVWHSFSFTLEENSSWTFPYAGLLLYRFMSTVSVLTVSKTHACSRVISPRSNAAIAWFMGYGDCAQLYRQVWRFYLVKVIVPEHTKWQDSPTGLALFCCSQWQTHPCCSRLLVLLRDCHNTNL